MYMKTLEENERLCELHALGSMLDYASLRASEIGAPALVTSINASKKELDLEIKKARYVI